MIPESEWIWLGHPGHFIAAWSCQFRMATRIGEYLVSTVGEYQPYGREDKGQPIGGAEDDLYETYVFKAGQPMDCQCAPPDPAIEIDGRRTSTAAAAHACHMEFCRKYAAMKEGG